MSEIFCFVVLYGKDKNPCFISGDIEDAEDYTATSCDGCITNDPNLYRVERWIARAAA